MPFILQVRAADRRLAALGEQMKLMAHRLGALGPGLDALAM
jgi:hypothetical protein